MSDTDVNIVFRLTDQFTNAADRVQMSVERVGASVAHAGIQIERFGSKMTLVGGAITGGFLLSMKSIEGASFSVQATFIKLENVMRNLQLSVANSVQPAVERFTNVLAGLVDAWTALDPKMRATILQSAYLAGAFLLSAGLIIKLTGAVVAMVGKFIELVGLALTPTGLAIIAISAAIVLMILHWDKVRQYVLPIINAVVFAVNTMTLGIAQAIQAMYHLTEFSPLNLIPAFAKARDDAKAFADELDKISANNMQDILTGKQSGLAKYVDDTATMLQTTAGSWKQFFDLISKFSNESFHKSTQTVLDWANLVKSTVQQLAQAMSQSLGNFFFNVLTGQLKSARQMFIDFGNTVLQILTQVLARVLLAQAFGNLPGVWGQAFAGLVRHSGGTIERAHSGLMNQDEVPIIAQTGEGILSRQGMGALGANNFRSLNRGDGGVGGVTYQPVMVFQLWDTSDIMRNRKSIEGIIEGAMRRNSSLRGAIKRYG